MGDTPKVGGYVAEVNVWNLDPRSNNITTRGTPESAKSRKEALAKAEALAESGKSDAVVFRRVGKDDEFLVAETNEVGELGDVANKGIVNVEPPEGYEVVGFVVGKGAKEGLELVVPLDEAIHQRMELLVSSGVPRPVVRAWLRDGEVTVEELRRVRDTTSNVELRNALNNVATLLSAMNRHEVGFEDLCKNYISTVIEQRAK